MQRVAAVLALSLILAACAPSVRLITGAPTIERTSDGRIVGCYTNFANGRLIVDPEFGTAIVDADVGGITSTVAWRPGFSARRAGAEVEVLDPTGRVVAITGRTYRIAGGYVKKDDWPEIPVNAFWACDTVTPLP
jgi:hypothetical protein